MFRRIALSKRFVCSHAESVRPEINEIIPASEIEEKILKIAIIGAPNSGKSTLINGLIGRRVCSESQKVHTTRNNIKAIDTIGQTQLIFLDTPGVVSRSEVKKHKLENSFVSHPVKAVLDADVIGLVHDVSNKWVCKSLDWKALKLVQEHRSKTSILILNKIDILKEKYKLFEIVKSLTNNSLESFVNTEKLRKNEQLEDADKKITKKLRCWPHFSEVFMVSALTNDGVSDLKEYLLQQAKPGPWIFRRNEFTDDTPENIILKTLQSRLLEHLPQEIPYSLSTQIEYFEEKPDGRMVAVVLLICPTLRIQKLVVGRNGKRIKLIAREAEQLIKNTFLEDFYLKVAVTTAGLPD